MLRLIHCVCFAVSLFSAASSQYWFLEPNGALDDYSETFYVGSNISIAWKPLDYQLADLWLAPAQNNNYSVLVQTSVDTRPGGVINWTFPSLPDTVLADSRWLFRFTGHKNPPQYEVLGVLQQYPSRAFVLLKAKLPTPNTAPPTPSTSSTTSTTFTTLSDASSTSPASAPALTSASASVSTTSGATSFTTTITPSATGPIGGSNSSSSAQAQSQSQSHIAPQVTIGVAVGAAVVAAFATSLVITFWVRRRRAQSRSQATLNQLGGGAAGAGYWSQQHHTHMSPTGPYKSGWEYNVDVDLKTSGDRTKRPEPNNPTELAPNCVVVELQSQDTMELEGRMVSPKEYTPTIKSPKSFRELGKEDGGVF